jgi:hypothetical protein
MLEKGEGEPEILLDDLVEDEPDDPKEKVILMRILFSVIL